VAPDDQIEIEAVAFSALVQERELAWEPPLRDLMQKPEAAEFVWRRLQYVFDLDDPRAFPRVDLDWGDAEERLRRFVAHGRTLAQTSLLSAGDNVRITQADSMSPVHAESDVSPPDVTVGFMTLLRQCYANDEEASFARVRNALKRRLRAAGRADLLAIAQRWQQAHADLLNKGLEERVQERLHEDGVFGGTARRPGLGDRTRPGPAARADADLLVRRPDPLGQAPLRASRAAVGSVPRRPC
jgi:hypothetical protein